MFSLLPGVCADWNPKLAAQYLDTRQKDWLDWPRANGGAKPCISCHTNVTYLMVRPALRKVLGESQPTAYETALMKSLRERVGKQEPPAAPGIGVESVLATLFLAPEASPDAAKALDRLWALQIREGKAKGSWNWYSLDDDPWEMPESNFYGAALAAIAVGGAPAEYRARPEVKERLADVAAFLRAGQESQPLHNRMMLLWASAKLPEAVTPEVRRAIVEAAAAGWKLDDAGARPVRGTRESRPAGGPQRLRHRARDLCAAALRGPEPKTKEGLDLAQHPPEFRRRILDGGIHEQAIPRRFDGIQIHVRCRHCVRLARPSGSRRRRRAAPLTSGALEGIV
jgi:hypothetical protein